MPDRQSLLQRLRTGVSALDLSLTDEQYNLLIDYLELMMKWNKAFNLSAIRDPLEAVDKHLVDSLSMVPLIEQGKHYLDIGAGAGLPGIPLSIVVPEARFTMVDSNGKKTRFIQQAIMTLSLGNANVINSRIESLPDIDFDIVTARALGTLAQMTEWLGSRLVGERYLLAMKGVYPEQEMQELSSEFVVEDVRPLAVSVVNAQRHAVWVKRAN